MKRRGFLKSIFAAGATLCLPRLPASKGLLGDGAPPAARGWRLQVGDLAFEIEFAIVNTMLALAPLVVGEKK